MRSLEQYGKESSHIADMPGFISRIITLVDESIVEIKEILETL
jgi:hypothetical protein